jgi:hypothetical protein
MSNREEQNVRGWADCSRDELGAVGREWMMVAVLFNVSTRVKV